VIRGHQKFLGHVKVKVFNHDALVAAERLEPKRREVARGGRSGVVLGTPPQRAIFPLRATSLRAMLTFYLRQTALRPRSESRASTWREGTMAGGSQGIRRGARVHVRRREDGASVLRTRRRRRRTTTSLIEAMGGGSSPPVLLRPNFRFSFLLGEPAAASADKAQVRRAALRQRAAPPPSPLAFRRPSRAPRAVEKSRHDSSRREKALSTNRRKGGSPLFTWPRPSLPCFEACHRASPDGGEEARGQAPDDPCRDLCSVLSPLRNVLFRLPGDSLVRVPDRPPRTNRRG
jgi:hypothetical protein